MNSLHIMDASRGVLYTISDIDVEVRNGVAILSQRCEKFHNVKINFSGKTGYLKLYTQTLLKGLYVKGALQVDFVNDRNHGDKISKLLNRKAPMNKYRNRFEYPITPEAEETINDYFKDSIDMSTVREIDYTQSSRLLKYADFRLDD